MAPEPAESHVHGFERLWDDLLVSSACAVELLVWIGFCVCGWPNSLSIVCMEMAVFALIIVQQVLPLRLMTWLILLLARCWGWCHCWSGFRCLLPWTCGRLLGFGLLVLIGRRHCCRWCGSCCLLCRWVLHCLRRLHSQGTGGIFPLLVPLGLLVWRQGRWGQLTWCPRLLGPKIKTLPWLLGWISSPLCLAVGLCWVVLRTALSPHRSSWRWGAVGSAVLWGGVLEALQSLIDVPQHQ